VAMAAGSVIKDAATVVSYSRGFDVDTSRFDGTMSKEEALAALRDIRTVVLHPTSFLQTDLESANEPSPIHDTLSFDASRDVLNDNRFASVAEAVSKDDVALEEDEEPKFMKTWSAYPAPVANGFSIDNGKGIGDDMGYAAKGSFDPNKLTMKLGPLQLHVIKRLQDQKLVCRSSGARVRCPPGLRTTLWSAAPTRCTTTSCRLTASRL